MKNPLRRSPAPVARPVKVVPLRLPEQPLATRATHQSVSPWVSRNLRNEQHAHEVTGQ